MLRRVQHQRLRVRYRILRIRLSRPAKPRHFGQFVHVPGDQVARAVGRLSLIHIYLGGVMDVVSTFCGAENLLMALYDAPEEVLRLCGEAQEAWFQAYWDLAAVLRENGNPGYSD